MSECDLCGEGDTILYPVKPKVNITRHLCRGCVEEIQEIKLPPEYE
jgi:hypothetical protein